MIKLNIYLFKILRNVWQISCMYLNITFWINVFLQYETAKQSCKHCCRPETAFSLLQCLTDGKFAEMTHRAPGRCWCYSLFFQISENRKLWKVSLCNISRICTWSISVLYLALPESTFSMTSSNKLPYESRCLGCILKWRLPFTDSSEDNFHYA